MPRWVVVLCHSAAVKMLADCMGLQYLLAPIPVPATVPTPTVLTVPSAEYFQ
jgi:hypothetical protein